MDKLTTLIEALTAATAADRLAWNMEGGRRTLPLGEGAVTLERTLFRGAPSSVEYKLDITRPALADRNRSVCIAGTRENGNTPGLLARLWETVEAGREATAAAVVDAMIETLTAARTQTTPLRTIVGYADSEARALEVAAALFNASRWFQFDPLPFDRWQVTLKDEPDNRTRLEMLCLPDCPPDPPGTDEDDE